MGYNVVMADPPWSYRNKRSGGSMIHQDDRYKTMPLGEIKSLPIGKICEKNCVLFLWATVPMLPEALEVMSAWGFKYKTTLFWWKIMSGGTGWWFRGQMEVLLLGVRGKVKAFRIQKGNIHQARVGKHSEKPDYFRELIEQATDKIGFTKRVELFATKKPDGWDAVGLAIGSEIHEWLEGQ